METLSGSAFLLREWLTTDVQSLAKHANNINIAKNLRDGFPHPYTLHDAKSWIEMIRNNKHDLVYAIDIGGEACGGIGLHPMKDVYRFNAELGYWLSEEYWGRGIVSEAVGLVVRHGFTKFPWRRIYAGVFSTNAASMKLLLKNGFMKEAVHRKAVKKEGEFLDEVIFALLREDWERMNEKR